MKKMSEKRKMKKQIYFILSGLFFFLCLNFIIADFTLGTPDFEIEKTYSQREIIIGWVNISFQDQSKDTLLSGFGKTINVIEFLEANDASYSCFPSDCQTAYTSSNPVSEKTLNFAPGSNVLMGLKLVGQVDGINSLVFDVSTIGSEGSCEAPIKIDILDDGIIDSSKIDWKANVISSELCSITSPYGCYNEGDFSGDKFLITEEPYCAKTEVSLGRGFKIGAEIEEVIRKGGDVDFKMEISTDLESQDCIASATISGDINCMINLTEPIEKQTNVEICISVYDSSDNGKYEIKYEEVNPCGYAGTTNYDFPIFIYPFKYSGVLDFTFNQNFVDQEGNALDLSDEISMYIENKYDGDCDPECIIPIRFYSGETKDLVISNLDLIYMIGGSKSETNIYDISETEILINSDFQKLDLEKAGFLTPSTIGNGEFILELGNEEIFKEDITIISLPEIVGILPDNAAALVPTKFTMHLSEDQEGLTYIWNFGDGSVIESTNINTITHTYPSTGTYTAEVTIKNNAGNSTKTISINVIPPEEAILETLDTYKLNLEEFRVQLNNIPEWIKKEIENLIDIENLEADLNSYEQQYERAFNEQSYVNLMKALLEFKVPSGLTKGKGIPKGALFLNEEQLNLEFLKSLGAGNFDEEEDYNNLINTWLASSLEATIETKPYLIDYAKGGEELITYVKVTLVPNNNLGEVYFLVHGDPNLINFLNEINTKSIGENAEALIFGKLQETQIIEFLYPGTIEIGDYPIYISPEFNKLVFGVRPGVCNFNNICEKDLNENYKNCRNDCKPVLSVSLYLIILVFVFFIVYIILQEWYKRRYESKLFPDKNQLFNLINFMNNSLNQGIQKSGIVDSLKNLNWNEEQLNYAWKKFNGYRTGMWEIPIFKWVEKKEVKKELAKRQNIPIQKKPVIQKRISRRIRRPRSNLRRLRGK